VLVGTLALATVATFDGADRAIPVPSIAAFHASDVDHAPILKSEIHHVGV